MSPWKRLLPEAWLVISLLSLVLLGVACGTAATATPAPAPTKAPATPAAPEAAPTPAPTLAAVATTAPTLTAVPGSVVNPGKVIWMTGNFGNERFDQTFSAPSNDYNRLVHAFPISSDVKEGSRVLIPGIATQWERSTDGLTWNFTIRKGVKFHDGTELTAEDVLWSLRHNMGPESKEYATNGSTLPAIMDRIEQTGPDRVSVTTKMPFLFFLYTSEAGGAASGTMLPKRATLHNLKEEADYDRNPIGAGPLKLAKHVPLEVMSFERFADYYHQPKNGFSKDKRVNFTALDLRLIPEEATRVAALRAGQADIAPISMATRSQVEAGGGRLVFGQEGGYFDIRQRGCWKVEFPCHDQRVRQALAYAIDKQSFQKLYRGADVMQVKGWSLVTPSTLGYSPELDPFPFDPVKARRLLADAGYPDGKGFGKLVVNTWVSSSLPLLPESAQLGADFWRKELGLDVEVKVWDKAALNKAAKLSEEIYGQIWWRDNETLLDAASSLRGNYGSPTAFDKMHNDPELFALVGKAVAVFEPTEREEVLNSAYMRLRDEAYDISLGYVNIPWGVGPRIRTWDPYPLAFYPSALHTITLK